MANYFPIFLTILTLVTGLIWLLDKFFWAKKRDDSSGSALDSADEPYLVDTSKQIFPVLAFVLVLRSFLYEPFQIPSGSMMPTLLVGDFILVEKYAYGLRDPVFRTKFWETGEPQRGDVVVFKYPEDPNVDYIKRVVGLPGDRVVYQNKQLYIKASCNNGDNLYCDKLTPIDTNFKSKGEFSQQMAELLRFSETLGSVEHDVLRHPFRAIHPSNYFTQSGTKSNEWIVPAGQYFVLGDNRDNSRDSRFWGFVPESNLVGKAVAIWISFEFERSADSWIPSWVPSNVRFERVGGIQ